LGSISEGLLVALESRDEPFKVLFTNSENFLVEFRNSTAVHPLSGILLPEKFPYFW